ncbi:MAG: hypothetical protein IKE65_06950 [Clostridia bacterium]|nr:hypothetical protein [Clostridia bacterium]
MPSFICQNCKSTVRYRKYDEFCVCKKCSTRYEISHDDYRPPEKSDSYDINESLNSTFMPDEEGNVKKVSDDTSLDGTFIEQEKDVDNPQLSGTLEGTFISNEESDSTPDKTVHDIHLNTQEHVSGAGQDFEEFSSFEPFYRRTPQQDINQSLKNTFIEDEETAAIKKAAAKKAKLMKQTEAESEDDKYRYALRFMKAANTPSALEQAAELFHAIVPYKDAAALEQTCLQKAEDAKKDAIYYNALSRMGIENADIYALALEGFRMIPGWRDADELAQKCEEKIDTLRQEGEQRRLRKAKQRKKRKIIIAASILSVIIIAVGIFAMIKYFIPQSRYNSALKDMESGNVVTAYETFVALGAYKDSKDLADSLFESYKIEKLKVANVGDTVYLGKYDQNAEIAGTMDEIEWRVLDKKDGALLVISKNGLDCLTYNDKNAPTDWEHCALRKWLNKDFIETAFTPQESKRILTSTVSDDVNENYPIDIGNDTKDKVFCLSITEAEKYFADNRDRMCPITTHAYEKGAHVSEQKYASVGETCCWQLRTTGFDKNFAAFVFFDGEIRHYGNGVFATVVAVRPAMWIRTD